MFDDIDLWPTPASVGMQVMKSIRNKDARNFLEPSAGKGDLAAIIRGDSHHNHSRRVDCIEIEPELLPIIRDKGFPVVGLDWLTYSGVSYYEAIVMNPPFSAGAAHLLKAWDFSHGGEIACLLNAETLNNPHTKERQRLADVVKHNGTVEILGQVFRIAQRKTDVNVALVHLDKPMDDDDLSDLWANQTTERMPDDDIGADPAQTALAYRDALGNMQHYYDMALTHMFRAFQEMKRARQYIVANKLSNVYRSDKEMSYEDIIGMAYENPAGARAEFSRAHRRDCWMSVFNHMKFHKWLDKKQTDQFLRDIEANTTIPFTKENIEETAYNVFSQRRKLFEMSCANVFEELTKHYKDNTYGSAGGGGDYVGWKTNDNYKVNEKLVFPYGCRFDKDMGTWTSYYREAEMCLYNDLDRVLCILDSGKDFERCRKIGDALHEQFGQLEKRRLPWGTRGSRVDWSVSDQQCESEYFHIRFWQKGTVHLKWKRKDLLELFNQTAAAGRKWVGSNTRA